jgi:hypothetical protein
VSRILYTGPGGFNPFSYGIEFSISPRAHHIRLVSSPASTNSRGIIHTKVESLCGGGYHRLHLICGESLRSDFATWLRVGTTALVIALLEADPELGSAVELAKPVEALHTFAKDTSCTTRVPLHTGGLLGALDIQRHYLVVAEDRVGEPFMPPWAPAVCEAWRDTLDRLEKDPVSLSRKLDWAIKLPIFTARARQRGFDWETVSVWSAAANRLIQRIVAAGVLDPSLWVDSILRASSPIESEVRETRRALRRRGLDLSELPAFLELRRELCEIDMRWGQIGSGVFADLEASGLLDHRVPGMGSVTEAMVNPPSTGRARLRGAFISRQGRRSLSYQADWTGIWQEGANRFLDLSDPFATEEIWQARR